MAVVAAGNEGEADWLADGCLSGAEWDWAVSGGVCADQSAALLGDEQCSGGRVGFGGGGSGGGTGDSAGERCYGASGGGEFVVLRTHPGLSIFDDCVCCG